jgi:hypothetical protein
MRVRMASTQAGKRVHRLNNITKRTMFDDQYVF